MNKKSLLNEKEAVRVKLQPPQINRAAQPEQPEGKGSSEAADLQQKMEIAAKILVGEWLIRSTPSYGDFDSFVFCTPENLFFRLNGAWIRIAIEYVEEAAKETSICATGRWTPSRTANYVLRTVRERCRELKRVSWTLPRLKGGIA